MLHPGRVLVAFVAALALVVSLHYVLWFYGGAPLRPDYSVFWVASEVARSNPARLYDVRFITEAQAWLVDSSRARPWAYPPSALVALAPFAWLPFWPSYLSWVAVSVAAFLAAARRYVRGWWLVIVAISPPLVVASFSGQMSLIVGGAGLWGVSISDRRPLAAGALLGIAAAVKPQAMIAAPLMLNRKGLVGFAAGGAAMVAASLPLGLSPWLDWVAALPAFADTAKSLGLVFFTPTGVAHAAGISAGPVWLIGAVVGVALALACRGGGARSRALGLFGAGLLISPYAMLYDTVALVPIAVAALRYLWLIPNASESIELSAQVPGGTQRAAPNRQQ